ncbi:hypothetical protein SAMN05446037_1006130 [Anaerovirgula multivorans]|uniref:Uncharacterized protein n=1 Tax=Anaerovirgula multivorans TaxID=312168 RepID=A0A239CSF0_9FIRM|nr:hypothetical protein [Anaerovirgula multivorans]SNS23095.1 hypothetical protein SAMN05446037_1006130 [Anaerovirgula multivorans]
MVRINAAKVDKYLHITEEKKKEWLRLFPFLEFDRFGRASVGNIQVDDTALAEELYNFVLSESFFNAIKIWENKNELKLPNYFDIALKRFNCGTTRLVANSEVYLCSTAGGEDKHMRLSKILAQIQAIWEKETCPEYSELRKEIKKLRKEGLTFSNSLELVDLSEKKKSLEIGNFYVAYDHFQNAIKKGTEMWLSINPLDLITSSGNQGDNPTRFDSCWSLEMELASDEIHVDRSGCHSSGSACLNMGRITNRGILFIKNGRTLNVPGTDFDFIGYSERSHVWLDEICGNSSLFLERVYPSKCYERRRDWFEALTKSGFDVKEESCNTEEFDYQDSENLNNYSNKSGGALFLDNVAITSGTLYYLNGCRMDYDYDDNIDGIIEAVYCCECGDSTDSDDRYEVGGNIYCSYCFNDRYVSCQYCGEPVEINNAIEIEGYYYCEYHANVRGCQCEGCGEWAYTEHMEEYNGDYYCRSCFDEHHTYCANCGEAVSYNDAVELEYEYYCEDCVSVYSSCGSKYPVSDGYFVCKNCTNEGVA